MMRRLVLAFAALACVSCGYHVGTVARLPASANAVYVPVFRNETAEIGAEAWFTEAFRGEARRARLEGGDASDLRAVGIIEQIETSGMVASIAGEPTLNFPVNQVIHYRVEVTATVRLLKGTEEVARTKVVGEEAFLPGAAPGGEGQALDGARYEAYRRLAVQRLSERLMREAFENLTGRWEPTTAPAPE